MVLNDDFLSQQRLLVISPHADDESYGCAGSMARIKSLGGEVYVVLVSVGDLLHYSDITAKDNQKFVDASTRLKEFSSVMEYLEVDDWDVLFTDEESHLALDAIPRKKLVHLIEAEGKLAINRIKPTMLMIPAFSYNQDHEALFRACITATRPGLPPKRHLVPYILAYDNTSLFWSLEREKFHANFYVDISNFLDKKIQALRMHESQMRDALFHGSPESLELATKVRGREVSVDSAEGFMCLRAIF
jgi:N-acetylglucosamine malate deacetylase 1